MHFHQRKLFGFVLSVLLVGLMLCVAGANSVPSDENRLLRKWQKHVTQSNYSKDKMLLELQEKGWYKFRCEANAQVEMSAERVSEHKLTRPSLVKKDGRGQIMCIIFAAHGEFQESRSGASVLRLEHGFFYYGDGTYGRFAEQCLQMPNVEITLPPLPLKE